MRLEGSELLEPAFAEFGERVVLFCHVTSHVEGEAYPDLLRKKGGTGWPHIAILDAEGKVLAIHKGERSTEAFSGTLDQAVLTARTLVSLGERTAAGDKEAAVRLFELQVDLGHLEPAAARRRLAELEGLSDEHRAALDAKLIAMEVAAIAVTASEDPQTQYDAGERYATMIAEDRIPADEDALYFWYFTAVYAAAEEQADLLEKAIAGLGRQRRIPKSVVTDLEEELKRIRGK